MNNPFTFVEAVSTSKKNIIRDGTAQEKDYNAFLCNRALSYFADSVLYANEMNVHSSLPAIMQFEFYLHSLRPRKRFSKWFRPETNADEEAVMRCLGINRTQAKEALKILSQDDVIKMRNQTRQEGLK